jgi:hypothetical protein
MKKRELEALNVVQLRALARDRGMPLRARLKSEIVEEIQKGLRALKAATRKPKAAGEKGRAAPGLPKRGDVSPGGLKRKDLRAKTVAGLRETAKSLGVRLRERRKEAIIEEILRQARRPAGKKKHPLPSKRRATSAMGKKPAETGRRGTSLSAHRKRKVTLPATAVPAPEERPLRVSLKPERARKERDTRRRSDEHHVLGSVPPWAPEKRDAPARGARSDTITAIAVEPREIFLWWELTAEAMSEGRPSLRAYDAGAGEGEEKPGTPLFQLTLSSPSGSAFLKVPPGEDLFIALGVVTRGKKFLQKAKSVPFSTPPESFSGEEARLPDEYFTFHPLAY